MVGKRATASAASRGPGFVGITSDSWVRERGTGSRICLVKVSVKIRERRSLGDGGYLHTRLYIPPVLHAVEGRVHLVHSSLQQSNQAEVKDRHA